MTGLDSIDLVYSTLATVAPHMHEPSEFEVTRWLRDYGSAYWIAALICESELHLGKTRNASYLSTILRNRAQDGWACEDAAGYVTYMLNPGRRQRMQAVNAAATHPTC